jgi:hypothetical protein
MKKIITIIIFIHVFSLAGANVFSKENNFSLYKKQQVDVNKEYTGSLYSEPVAVDDDDLDDQLRAAGDRPGSDGTEGAIGQKVPVGNGTVFFTVLLILYGMGKMKFLKQ